MEKHRQRDRFEAMNFRIILGLVLILSGIGCFIGGIWKASSDFDRSSEASREWFEKARSAPGEHHPLPKTGSGGIPVPVLCFGGVFALGAGGFLVVAGIAGSQFRQIRSLATGGAERVREDVEQLAKLRADGYISGEDYEKARKRVMDDL